MRITFDLKCCHACRHMQIVLIAISYGDVECGHEDAPKEDKARFIHDRYSIPDWCPLKQGKPY